MYTGSVCMLYQSDGTESDTSVTARVQSKPEQKRVWFFFWKKGLHQPRMTDGGMQYYCWAFNNGMAAFFNPNFHENI